jgi:O-antigen ligase
MIIVLLAMLLYRSRDWRGFFLSGPSKYLTFFAFVALFSVGASPFAHYFAIYNRCFEIMLAIGLFHCIKTELDSESAIPFVSMFAWILFAIALFQCVIGITQYFLQHSIGLHFLGELKHLFTFEFSGGKRWVFDEIFSVERHSDTLARVSGTLQHPNVLGGFLFCTLLSSIYLYFSNNKCKTLLLTGISLQFVILILSFSRAALFVSLLMIAFSCVFYARHINLRKRINSVIVVLSCSAVLCVALFHSQILGRGGIFNYNKEVRGADTERVLYQKIAWEMFKERPFLGQGMNSFKLHTHRFAPKGKRLISEVHNIYLHILAETGLLGAGCFFLFLFAVLRHAYVCMRSAEGILLFTLFIGNLLIGCCDFYFIKLPEGQILFFGISALLYAVIKSIRKRENKMKISKVAL